VEVITGPRFALWRHVCLHRGGASAACASNFTGIAAGKPGACQRGLRLMKMASAGPIGQQGFKLPCVL